jgi:hypothetical protein
MLVYFILNGIWTFIYDMEEKLFSSQVYSAKMIGSN